MQHQEDWYGNSTGAQYEVMVALSVNNGQGTTKTSTKSTSAITRIGTMPIVLLSPPSDWDLPIAGAVVDVGKAGSGDAVVIGRKSVDSSPVGALVGEVV